jgi:hypothetical protein
MSGGNFTLAEHIKHHAILGVSAGGGGSGGGGELTTVSAPLQLDGYNISIPPATDVADGYMTLQDHQLLVKIQPGAPTSTFSGQLWHSTTDNELYTFDGYRSKFLSPNLFNVTAARNAGNSSDLYLRTNDGLPTNQGPFILPHDATLVAMTASCNTVGTRQAQVHLSLTLVPGAILQVISSTSALSTTLDIDFSEGDAIQIFMSGSNIDRPRVNLIFARRGS